MMTRRKAFNPIPGLLSVFLGAAAASASPVSQAASPGVQEASEDAWPTSRSKAGGQGLGPWGEVSVILWDESGAANKTQRLKSGFGIQPQREIDERQHRTNLQTHP
jgi:hypothetical protein